MTRRDGVVAACVWDHGGGQGPLSVFWQGARALDPDVHDESRLAGAREGHLAELFEAAGLREIQSAPLSADLEHPDIDAWWEPFTRGVGPAGAYVVSLDAERRTELRERYAHGLALALPERLPDRSRACRCHKYPDSD